MRLRRPHQPAERETIVPLIDVVFFLLVFFLLVGRYDATAPFEVRPAIATMGAPLPAGGRMVSVSADGQVALDGEAVARDALVGTLEAGETVKLNAHAEAEVRHVLPLADALAGAGARQVVLVVTPTPP